MDRRDTLKTLLCGGAATLGAIPLARAATAWDDVLKAAEKEGSASLYVSVAPAQVDAIIAGFGKAHPGIRLEAFRNSDSVINQKIRQELSINADGADVIFATKNNFFDELIAKGALVKPDLPALAATRDAAYHEGVVPVVSRLPLLVAYNTSLVKGSPRNYEDFIKPEFDGMLGIPVVDGSPITTGWWDFLRTKYPGYWDRLAKLKPRVYASSVPLAQAVASGEVAATILASPGAMASLITKGAPVKMVAPDQVYGMDLLVGVFKNSRRPNAARVLANYLFSDAGQTAINGGGLGLAIRPNIAGAMPPMAMTASDPRVETPEKLKKVVAEWKTTFNR
ncbi:MAG TPA: extracellular solute-binding protein [Ramlibacter sp.]|nr:extracellular solute-binding protein [Ramlibacter sp.]